MEYKDRKLAVNRNCRDMTGRRYYLRKFVRKDKLWIDLRTIHHDCSSNTGNTLSKPYSTYDFKTAIWLMR